MKNNKHKIIKALKILGKIVGGILILLILILLFIRSPWGQGIIKDKLISSITKKTNTELSVDKLFINFAGNLQLDGLYAEDKKGDTLIYSKSLEADIDLWPLIKGSAFSIDNLNWEGVTANISRKDSVEGYNFQFLMDAVIPSDSTSTPQDTTSAMAINIGRVDLKDIKLNYDDKVSGIDSKVNLGKLSLEMNKFDLENMDFRVDQAELSNTRFRYVQTKPFPDTPPKEETPMPYLVVDQLALNDVKAYYESQPDGILLDSDLQHFVAEMPMADLPNNSIKLNQITLNNSDVLVKTTTTKAASGTTAKKDSTTTSGIWPEYTVTVDNIDFENDNIRYFADSAEVKQGEFNPNALAFRDLNLQAGNIYLKNKTAGANIQQLNFSEGSGIDLNKLTVELQANDQSFSVNGLDLALNGNRLKGELAVQYDSLQQFIDQPEKARMALDLPEIKLDISDIYRFQPSLQQNPYMQSLGKKPINGSLTASGLLSKIDISKANFSWGGTTRLAAHGVVRNATNPDALAFDFPQFQLNSTKSDLGQFLDEEQLGLDLPQRVKLSGNFRGTPEDMKADAYLNTSEGDIDLKGSFSSSGELAFNADVQVKELNLGKLLKNESLGNLNLTLQAKGQGASVNSLDATMEANISSFQYNKYDIKGLKIAGKLEDGAGNITSKYKDDNINAALDAYVQLDSVKPAVNLDLNLKGANLQALGITSRDIRVALNLNADYKGNADSYDVNASIRDGVAVYNNQSYLLGALDATAYVRPDSTAVDINNRILDLKLESNASPADFSAALQRHYNSYFHQVARTDTVKDPVNLELKATIAQTPILNEVFFSNLEKLDTVHINVDFNEKERSLVADVDVPFVRYYSSEIDSLAIALNSDKNNMKFDLGFNSLDAGPLAIKKTSVSGNIANQKMDVDLLSTYKDEKILHIQSQIAKTGDTIDLHIVPKDLILNSKEWTMPTDNHLLIANNLRNFQDFRMTRNNQHMEISNNSPNAPKKNIAISFDGFDLAGFLSFLNPEEKLATGNLNGNLIIEDPFGETGLLADLQIQQFNMMEVDLGTLSLNGESLGNQNYKFDMGIKGGQVDLDLTGNYKAQQPAAALDLNLDLNNVEMTAMEGFTQGAVKAGSGSFSGNIKLSGTTAEPKYNGSLHFDDAGFTIATLSAGFLLPNETLKLDNKGLYFDNFTVQDDHGNDLVLDGDVHTESLMNPSFDLHLKANNFEVLNSTKEENDLYYGKATVNVDATLTGDLNLPKLDAKLEIGSNTNVTYVVPQADVAMQKREGIVMFVNKENPNAILTQTEEKPETFTGYDIDALISLDKDAIFTLVIDQETGDNFQVQGQGDLNLNVYPNGRTTLTGRYTMSGGHYEMSLYGLVKRHFDIADGSTVTWGGDPFNASLDVRAIYKVETSAYSLMAPQIAGSDENLANQYRRDLPFWVYLNIDGELMHPKISFGLDMPKDEQGYAGGKVYGRVQQLDQQENELNKQVFSLLVLNRFYPEPGSNGSQGGTMAIARDNLNEAISDQLNMFSDRLLGDTGVELNFGVDSYTDYQGKSAQQRTQLDVTAKKKLFDDRLIMSVGSQVDVQGSNRNPDEQTPVIGNVSLEYLLTKDGRFRLKGFRRNEFENVIDGQLIVSGIALIFTKEFNEFRNLWNSILNNQSKQNSEESK